MRLAHRPARTPVQVAVNLDQYRVRKRAHAGGLMNEGLCVTLTEPGRNVSAAEQAARGVSAGQPPVPQGCVDAGVGGVLAVIEAFGVDAEQDFDAVPGPLGDPWRGTPAASQSDTAGWRRW